MFVNKLCLCVLCVFMCAFCILCVFVCARVVCDVSCVPMRVSCLLFVLCGALV